MELHQLRYFVAVAEVENFTKAAARCFVSQPSLSQQIKKLEDELGQPLFDRLGHKVILTPAGRVLLDRARTILLEVEDASKAVKEEEGAGRLRLGVLPSIGPYLLPGLLRRCRERLPRLALEVDEDFRGPLVDALASGRLDLVIGSFPPPRAELEMESLFSESLLVVVSDDDPLACKPDLVPADLAGRKLVLLGESSSLGMQARRFLGEHQIPVETASRCAQVTTLVVLIAAGLGIGIIPRMAMKSSHAGVVHRSVRGAPARREIVLIRNKLRFYRPAMQAFREVLQEFCLEFADEEGKSAPTTDPDRRDRSAPVAG